MVSKNKILFAIVIVAILSLTFIASGITGMMSVNTVEDDDLCYSDNDCQSPEICCKFYSKEVGVCNDEENCDLILEKSKERDLDNLKTKEELDKIKTRSQIAVFGGFIFLLGMLLLTHVMTKREVGK